MDKAKPELGSRSAASGQGDRMSHPFSEAARRALVYRIGGMTVATLTIDLRALRANWRKLADMIAPAECAAVVKANAYGCGIEQAVAALWAEGARTFFVARIAEGFRARKAAPEATIYVLDGAPPGSATELRAANLRPALGALEEVREWTATGGGPAALHFDTGMNRLGLAVADADAALAALGEAPALVMSHFSSSEDIASPENARQLAAFAGVRAHFQNTPTTISNSSGIFLDAKPWFEMARPGYALYGGNPTPDRPNPMLPVVHLHAPVLRTRIVEPGDRVGYNARWTAKRRSRLAIIPIGYADGIPRAAKGTDRKAGAEVAIDGRRIPIVGRVSMDLTIVDVTDLPAAATERGAPVEVLGSTIAVDDFGARSRTIGYEILTGLGDRYARNYRG
jgi:alanine racemase